MHSSAGVQQHRCAHSLAAPSLRVGFLRLRELGPAAVRGADIGAVRGAFVGCNSARGRPPISCALAPLICVPPNDAAIRFPQPPSTRRTPTNPWSPARPPPSAGSPPARPKSTPRRGAPPGHVPQGLPRRAPGAQGVSISTALLPAGRRRRRGGQPRRPLERRAAVLEREPAAEPRADAADSGGAAEPAPPRRRAGLRVPVHGEPQSDVRYEPTGYEPTASRTSRGIWRSGSAGGRRAYYGAGSPSPRPPRRGPVRADELVPLGARRRGPPGPDDKTRLCVGRWASARTAA